MNAAELRGYVRAFAMGIARTVVQRTVVEHHWPQETENELHAAALERATHLVVREIATPTVVSLPLPHVRARSAA